MLHLLTASLLSSVPLWTLDRRLAKPAGAAPVINNRVILKRVRFKIVLNCSFSFRSRNSAVSISPRRRLRAAPPSNNANSIFESLEKSLDHSARSALGSHPGRRRLDRSAPDRPSQDSKCQEHGAGSLVHERDARKIKTVAFCDYPLRFVQRKSSPRPKSRIPRRPAKDRRPHQARGRFCEARRGMRCRD